MTQIGKPPADEAQIHAGSVAECPKPKRPWVLAAAILGSSMAFIDGTVVNVALPAIQTQLDATAFQAQWVVEAYALLLAALLLVGGALGDHLGRRRIFALGALLFALASLLCGLAQTVQQLIAARALQGVGGALLVPGSLALISAAYPEAERGRAIGTWSGASGITAAIGPVLSGFLVDHVSWSWAFFINLPMAAAVLWICWRHVPESRGGAGARAALDLPGAVLATLALGGIVYAFIEAPMQGWTSPPVLAGWVTGLATGVAFVWWEAHAPAPMLPLGLFRIGNFAGANLLTLLLYAALGGALYFLPLNLIQVQGRSATMAGAALLPFIAIMFALSRWAGSLVDRFGPRLPLVAGPGIAGVGFALLALPGTGADYWSGFFPGIVVLGFGMTITVAPLTTTVMNSVDEAQAGLASGINNAVSRAASVLALAVFGLMLAAVYDDSLSDALPRTGAPADAIAFVQAQQARLAATELPPNLDPVVAAGLREAIASAYVEGYRVVMLTAACLAFLSGLSAWWMIERRLRTMGKAEGEAQGR